jgi:hypothetical protein
MALTPVQIHKLGIVFFADILMQARKKLVRVATFAEGYKSPAKILTSAKIFATPLFTTTN